jgi:cytoskeletal protein CcmA (bactofilin family)
MGGREVKLGNRREYGKLNSDWAKRHNQDELPADEYEETDDDLDSQPGSFTPRALDPLASMPSSDFASVIGAGTTWKGNVSSEGSIRIEGNAQGEIRATDTVLVGSGADVKATIYAKYVIIAGAFDGDLFCSERLELQPQSKIKGAIRTKALSVGEGAFIDGEIHMGEVDELTASGSLGTSARHSRNGGKKAEEEPAIAEA